MRPLIVHKKDEKSSEIAIVAQKAFWDLTGVTPQKITNMEVANYDGGDPDVVVAIGGDGTVLAAMSLGVRVLAINTGTVGFLATHSSPTFDGTVELVKGLVRRLAIKDYWMEDHYPLIVNTPDYSTDHKAYNDLVIQREIDSPMLELEILVGGQSIGPIRADGIIVATQIGSTGYSLSAGGPILSPGLIGMVLTPICPRAAGARPLVLSGGGHVIEISSKTPARFLIDGQVVRIDPNNHWTIEASEYHEVPIIQTDLAQPYMASLRGKLGWGV